MSRSAASARQTAPAAALRARHRRALRYLRAADPGLRRVIDRVGPFRLRFCCDPFVTLAGSIVHQQLSMAAARSIRYKLRALCLPGRVTPQAILALSDRELRGVGLSGPKVRYLRALATAFSTGELTARRLRRLPDEEVIRLTTALPGIGRWTAEMLLIFCLKRPDVWPVDDFGLRTAVRSYLELRELPDRQRMRQVAEPWAPYRTYAAWYLWRSLDNPILPAVAEDA